MFGRLHLLLAAACVAALFTVAFSQLICESSRRGELIGTQYDFSAILPKGQRDVPVHFPKPPACRTVNGVLFWVCDAGQPQIEFISWFFIIVHRRGYLDVEGTVHMSAYCD